VLDGFLNSVIGVQFEKQHKVNVVSPSRVENCNILNTDDGGHSLVSADAQHTEDFFAELHTCDDVIKDGKEVVFVARVFIDVFHIFQDFRKVFRRLD
jgi:hypothetical protein